MRPPAAVRPAAGLLEIRRSAAQSGIAITATDLLLIKEDEPGIGSIDVHRQEGAAGEAIPAGRLECGFRDQRGRIAASAARSSWRS